MSPELEARWSAYDKAAQARIRELSTPEPVHNAGFSARPVVYRRSERVAYGPGVGQKALIAKGLAKRGR